MNDNKATVASKTDQDSNPELDLLLPARVLIDTIYQNAAEGLLLRAGGGIHTCSCSAACEKILDAIDIYLDR